MKPEQKFKNKKEETSMPSVSLLIKSPIQVLTGPNWFDIESPFMSTFLPFDHSSTKLRHNSHSLTRRWESFTRRWNLSMGGGKSCHLIPQGILHKEVESFTRRW